MIFVTVGGRPYPFDRLFEKIDNLISDGIINDEVFAQIGTAKYIPKSYQFTKYISQEEFTNKINKADVVITHGASGSIMKALNAKKKVIAVTRLKEYGEHIDNHQVQMNKAFGDNKYVVPVFELDELGDAYLSVINGKNDLKEWVNEDRMSVINLIDDYIKENWNN